jgi:gas vesicle structural protein
MPQLDPETKDAALIEPSRLKFSGLDDLRRVSLCETLDRVLNKGVVMAGEVTISVADIELVYLGLHLVLSSVETARAGGSLGLRIALGREDHPDAMGRIGTSRV